MFAHARRRLALVYAATFAAALVLLGPVLYLSFSHQLADASDAALRLAAQRQAVLALDTSGTTLGLSPRFRAHPALDQRDTFSFLVAPDGRLRANPTQVHHAGLPDLAAVRQAARQRVGLFSTVRTRDAGDIRLFTVPLLRGGRVIALLQAGRSLDALSAAQRSLLVFLLELGAAAVAAATVGGLVLSRLAMRPIHAAFAAQRAFVADASHELRTPLTLIRTNAEVLLDADAVHDPADRALVEDIIGLSERMGGLIGGLLLLARLDAGALPLARDAVDLAELVRTACRQMERLAERHGIQVVLDDLTPLAARGDRARLEQVVLILLDNAVKYSPAGGRVTVAVRRRGVQAVVEVSDTGCGLDPEEIGRLFARFHRGRWAGQSAEGSGLGLSIAQGIVRAHGGHIAIASGAGSGTCVTVTLPLAAREAAGRRGRD